MGVVYFLGCASHVTLVTLYNQSYAYCVVAFENPCHLHHVNTGLNLSPFYLNVFTGVPIIERTRVEAITASSVHNRRQVGGYTLHSDTCMCGESTTLYKSSRAS